MAREIPFVTRSLFNGLLEIYRSSRLLALASFLLILFISSVIPLSILWLFQCLFLDRQIIPITSPWLWTLLTIWSIAELLFLLYQGYLYTVIQRQPTAPQLSAVEREQLVSSSLASIKDLQRTLSKWFLDRPFHEIDRQSVRGWLAFAFYSKKPRELNEKEEEEINALIEKIELDHRLEVKNERSSSNAIDYMKHILDPVRVILRPLIYYVVTDTLLDGILATSLFRYRGYEHVQIGQLKFWTYREKNLNENDEEEPVIFFHGIGAGLLMYQPFIARLHRQFSPSRRLIFISMRCICMRYPSLRDIPKMSETVSSIRQISEHYKFRKATFIGHSYGTACLSWIVQKCPEHVSRLIFLDPICFSLFEPYVVYNFVYRIPYKLGHMYMYYFVCRELGISYVISRHFWWTQNILFINQIPSDEQKRLVPTHVLLSGHDCIVNVHLVQDYLIENQIDYYWAPGLSHGDFMRHPDTWEKICQWIE